MFRVDADALSRAAGAIAAVEGEVGASVGRMSDANTGFLHLMSGAWATEGGRAWAAIECGAREIGYGISDMAAGCRDALAEVEGSVLPARDAALAAVGAQPASPRRATLDGSAPAAAALSGAQGSLRALADGATRVGDLLGGLEGGGAVRAALGALSAGVVAGGAALDRLGEGLAAYEAAVEAFEGEFASRLDPASLIDASVEARVRADLGRRLEEISGSGGFAAIGGADLGLRVAASAIEAGAGTRPGDLAWLADALAATKRNVRPPWEGRAGGYRVPGPAPKGSLLRWTRGGPPTLPDVGRAFVGECTDWLKPSNWAEAGEDALGLMKGIGGRLGFGGKASISELSEASELSKHAKGAAKGLGYVGSALSVIDTVARAGAAFESEPGDLSDKIGAAGAEVAKGAVRFGAGAAAGALAGFVGGPLGVAAGFAAGCAVDAALDWAFRAADDAGVTGAVKGAVSGALDAIGSLFGG
ncbi:MAG: hypothetical protein E7001_03220 [Coriobacteriaceae bacterium]|nr:hypothetical protein [Coriobacteriaceae bacterium]